MTALCLGVLFAGGSIYVSTWFYFKRWRENGQGLKK